MESHNVTLTSGGPGKSNDSAFELSVLFMEGDGVWSAQCLEYDIAAQAKTLNDLFYEMERVLVSQLALDEELGRKPFEGIARAPRKYWDAFERSQTTMDRPATGLKADSTRNPRIRSKIKVADRAA